MPRLNSLLLVLVISGAAATATAGSKQAPVLDTEFMERHVAPERDFDIQHLRLDLRLDFKARRVAGEAAITLSPLASPQHELVLHAIDLDIQNVDVAGAASFTVEPGLLRIDLGRAYAPEETLTVRIRYAVTNPRQGLNFIESDEAYKRPVQAWTQGETEENRYWFPSWDYPNDRATSEMVVTVPAGFTTISNGSLESQKENPDGTVTFHWLERKPHVNYLVSLIAGKFAHTTDRSGSTPIDIYVPPGSEHQVKRSFGETAEMIRVFERAFGYPYPFEKFAWTTVFDFRWGGMENVSAVTSTDRTLHDEAAHLTYRSEDLVSHELAHQWFGDLITCRHWSDNWLNEAFATYSQAVYSEAKQGEDGLDEQLLEWRQDYLEEVEKEYRRVIVTDRYGEADDIFDAHCYEKGALVIYMLRNILGDETFGRALRHYVQKHAWDTVDTSQLRVAFEEASGRDLGLFFEQWLYRIGHPILEASWRWNEQEGQVEIDVRQLQQIDSPAPIFDTPLDIRIYPAADAGGGDPIDHRVHLAQAAETFRFPAAKRPRIVALDPRGWLLAEINFQKPVDEWVLEVAEAPEVMGRVAAARALGDFIGDPEAVSALEKRLRTDPSRHVRIQAAESLGDMGTDGALEALAPGVDDPDARVRLKVAEALGSFHSERAARLAIRLIDRDPSPYVVGEAAAALGHTQAKGALATLERAARRTSHDETIRKGAYDGMAALESADAIAPLLAATRYGLPWRARGKAIESLGKLAKSLPDRRSEIRERLLALVADRHFDARRAAVVALGKSEDSEALPKLRQLARQHPDSWVRRSARFAVWQILKAERPGDREMVERLQKLERENRQLREDVERIRDRRSRDWTAERR